MMRDFGNGSRRSSNNWRVWFGKKVGLERNQITPKWLGLFHKKRRSFSNEMRKYNNPCSE
jgi:hypothetical protein